MKIDAPKETELLAMFLKMNADSLDERGIYPSTAVLRHMDGKLTCAALAIPTPETLQYAKKMVSEAEVPVVECAFGVDRSFKPGQGLPHEGCDFITIFYWDGNDLRYGCMQYDFKSALVHPVIWDNPFWCAQMDKEMTHTGLGLVYKTVQFTLGILSAVK